ncbi:MAG: glycine cleavage T C-terminal barrel domain-containing protein [Deinococcales bacterium]
MHKSYPSTRVRPSPFYEITLSEGVTGFSAYNHMFMPTGYGDPEGEYWRLIRSVSMWDVAVERQVQLKGPDAAVLAQILSSRDLSNCKIGQGKYVAICNHDGILINDPILLKLEPQLFWLFIADSNIWFWARAIAAERKLKVEISEPDVSPLAIQGPKAEDVTAALFGDWVRGLKYFWFKETYLEDIPLVLARSGWSKQGGFELYLRDSGKAQKLWQRVKEAGQPWGIGPGSPNPAERIESGLLSYGGDTDENTNPFEVRLGKYVNLDLPDEVIGMKALKKIHQQGPKRHQLGMVLELPQAPPPQYRWKAIYKNGNKVGDMTASIWSWRLEKAIAYALISRDCQAGDRVEVEVESAAGLIGATLCELPFL